MSNKKNKYFCHSSSFVDKNVLIGEGTKIWHFSHIQSGSSIGKNCSLGQNVNIGNHGNIGDQVKIQNKTQTQPNLYAET